MGKLIGQNGRDLENGLPEAGGSYELILTTTGTSGPATYDSGTDTLNIPQYTGGGIDTVSRFGYPGEDNTAGEDRNMNMNTHALHINNAPWITMEGGDLPFTDSKTILNLGNNAAYVRIEDRATGGDYISGVGSFLDPNGYYSEMMARNYASPRSHYIQVYDDKINLIGNSTLDLYLEGLPSATAANVLYYDPTTKKVTHGVAGAGGGYELILTTNGTSGAATYDSTTDTLNIPQYPAATSDNGLTKTGINTQLGGPLLHDTFITANFHLAQQDGSMSIGRDLPIASSQLTVYKDDAGMGSYTLKNNFPQSGENSIAVMGGRMVPGGSYNFNGIVLGLYGELGFQSGAFNFTGSAYFISMAGINGVVSLFNGSGDLTSGNTMFSGGTYNINVSGAANVDDFACIRALNPIQTPNATVYTGTITNHYGIFIDNTTKSGFNITNRYGVYQEGTTDLNMFKGPIQADGLPATTGAYLSVVRNSTTGRLELADVVGAATGSAYELNLTTTGTGAATYNAATDTLNIPTPPTPNIADGVYTPTVKSSVNTSVATASAAQWMRVGMTVTVSGSVTIDPTLGDTATEVVLSIPYDAGGVDFTANYEAAGTASVGDEQYAAAIMANVGDNSIRLIFKSKSAAAVRDFGTYPQFFYHYTYRIYPS